MAYFVQDFRTSKLLTRWNTSLSLRHQCHPQTYRYDFVADHQPWAASRALLGDSWDKDPLVIPPVRGGSYTPCDADAEALTGLAEDSQHQLLLLDFHGNLLSTHGIIGVVCVLQSKIKTLTLVMLTLLQETWKYIDVMVQDCGNSSAIAMELLQSWTKTSINVLELQQSWTKASLYVFSIISQHRFRKWHR